MYGIVNGDNAMMVVCTEGDSNAKLTASVSGQSKSSFNVCGFDFTVRDSDTYYMSGDNGTALTVFEDGDMKTDTLAVRYYPWKPRTHRTIPMWRRHTGTTSPKKPA